jgi:predicted permease
VTTAEAYRQFFSDILERLRASPGVRAAAVTSAVPLSNITPGQRTLRIEGRPVDAAHAFPVDPKTASEGYFETLGVPLVAGRSFTERDTLPVAVINASMAKYWDGADPVGSRFTVDFPAPPGQEPPVLTVIGVVGDFRLYGAERDVQPQFYTSFRQIDGGGGGSQLLVRTDGRLADLVPTIKSAVFGTDPQMPVEDIQPLDELRSGRLAPPALTAALLSIFAGVALAITLAGLAGIIGTSVSQRTREFGLRMALGATRVSVLQLVVRQGVALVGIGLIAGLGGAYLFSKLLTQYLFATPPTDAGAYLAVLMLFLAAAIAAAFGPARRATSIDPLIALRTE